MIVQRVFWGLGVSVVCACSATSAIGGAALVKAPVEQQCSHHGLEGCPELVSGVALYVDGDKSAATQKLRLAASKNVPADLKRFAQAISVALPGKAGGEIIAILTGDNGLSERANNAQEQFTHSDELESVPSLRSQSEKEPLARVERAQLSMAAQNDPMRLTTASVFPLRDPDKAICELGGSKAVCARLEAGPLVVTDAMTPPGCSTELMIGATNADGRFGWIAPTNSPGFHGARFLVRPDQWLAIAARSASLDDTGDDRCYVTWAAFKPRLWL
jgi:hypothetical protein